MLQKMNFVYLNILPICNGFVNEIVKKTVGWPQELQHLIQKGYNGRE